MLVVIFFRPVSILYKESDIKGCSLLPDGRMVFSYHSSDTVRFTNKEGVELFQIGKDKTGANTCDTVIVCIRFSCIFSTDMGGDSSATISWACLSFLRTKTISQGFDSTTTLANF
jgi:hypothetical protein